MFATEELVYRVAEASVSDLAKGNFTKKILILALSELNTPGNIEFITKVLSAANLDLLEDTLFAEIPANTPVNCFTGLMERPKFILVFGLHPAQVGLAALVQPYQTVDLNGSTWLFADSLSVLEPDRAKKGKLWEALKGIFL